MATTLRPHVSQNTSSLPINMPSKAPTSASYFPISRVSGSPPEISDVSTTTGSASDFDVSSSGYSGVDVIDTLNDRMSNVFDSSRLDTGIAKQTQISGQLNAKQRELLELQALMQRRVKGARANFAEGIKAAKETKSDLEWTHKRISSMKAKAERSLPSEYRSAHTKYAFDEDC
ncbi:uncharacterized protein CIMG_03422 [Coccidioides immitis RS]|uniref:Biogenesis of lysosome-related organelles complex 1 subunit KXD1 n=7 Tax=Coccidioides TaxID=5500 RepID=J3KBB6_COCIM|nr:uncharacterized protein CIMG_03422 [Coccidioides immitis RS]XP_003068771.1 hypothetical protein CPC735_007990 [Coccidioides posadasii C735 delta SOWgp]EFW20690.1 conserved hypothetical protein [Coccidioides posadasii str. Silveira]KMM72752.1 hypothetical protein CPAG_09044 [Coccidioides posadasii RMSCC 3488]KMP07632.1 hypothetical protein CIRG_07313 [Coccidioides immitis RMSCC 2394]KMU71917.1 hypothetical protein CISG_00226 [Coccidioides immitis RMSCC 3703]KMU82717.1 hypothetical protein C|eukprot:XP_003068771.1 hypothetical protein CPC735_007990 [Coccidioides posadasii C735 delta SOWgp]